MGPAIALRLRQHLTLTPQVQQALRLLQMSALEFAQEMEQALTANPFLEENPDAPAPPPGTKSGDAPVEEGAAQPTPSPRCRSTCASSCACRGSANATARSPRW
jgi:RNA polymerase sigma-54 factor